MLPKGVRRDRGRFRAEISIDRKRTNIGTFDTPEEAADAYRAAAIEHHGEFACNEEGAIVCQS
jgi:hypothetical protein